MAKRTKKRRPWGRLLCVVVLLVALAFVGKRYFAADLDVDLVRDDFRRLAAGARDLAGRAGDIAAPTASDEAAASGGGAIRVYFAPCKPLNPAGVDDRLIAFLEGAEASIDAAFYELQLPEAAEVLIAQHQAGVAVRLVSDSHYEERDAVRQCMAAGIPVVFDERSPFMHNKFCIVDGRRVWTGSTNITENGMFRNNNNALWLESPELAVNFAGEFLEMFEDGRFGGRSPRNTTYPDLRIAGIRVECYFAPEDHVQNALVDEIGEAETRIDFMAFAFTSKPLAEAMAKRMRDGVAVRGLFETRNAASKYSRDDYLAERGAEIHLDANKYTMHHKVIIIDGRTVVTGSYNFSAAADTKNDENVLILHDPGLARQYADEFEGLIAGQ